MLEICDQLISHGSVAHLEDLLAMCLEHPVDVKANVVTSFPARTGKRRPIRCEVKAS